MLSCPCSLRVIQLEGTDMQERYLKKHGVCSQHRTCAVL